MLAIVISRADSASEHVGAHLLDLLDWEETTDDSLAPADGGGTVYRLDDVELRYVDERHLETQGAAGAFEDPDLLVFASRHAGETGPLLTAHHTGNFGPAEFGGRDGALARAAPNAHRTVLRSLCEHAPDGYDVGMECTHHGPSAVGVPSLFVEVGSDEAQWDDPDAARAVARAILDLRGVSPDASTENATRRHLVGFGGGHYAPRFERVVRETDWAVGHVAAGWCLEEMGDPRENEAVVRAAFERSAAEHALVDDDRPTLRETIQTLGYRTVSETWVRETTGVALDLVEGVEAAITGVDEGLRFGEEAHGYDGDYTVVPLPDELLAEARGIDPDSVRTVVESVVVAYNTEQNGARVTSPVAVRRRGDVDDVVEELTDILGQNYDTVTRTDGEIIARKRAFDPGLARDAGVPDGPKFGLLAAGEAVEVEGKTVYPAEVFTDRTRRFTP